MSTKGQQILNPHSAWNAAPNNEPVLVIRADDWELALWFALVTSNKGGYTCNKELLAQALEMKKYHDENDIPF